jgi:hypothetical protein
VRAGGFGTSADAWGDMSWTTLRESRSAGLVGIAVWLSLFLAGCGASADPRREPRQPTIACRPPVLAQRAWEIMRDDFESGDLDDEWVVVHEGDALASLTPRRPHAGHGAGRLVVSASDTSRANVQTPTISGTHDITASGWFLVVRDGGAGSNVPTFRFFDGDSRILDVLRQNGSGQLFLRTATGRGTWSYVKLRQRMDLGRWYRVEVRAAARGATSAISVRVDGRQLYETTQASLPATRLTTVMIGSEHVKQVMDLRFDDVVVAARGPSSHRAAATLDPRQCPREPIASS